MIKWRYVRKKVLFCFFSGSLRAVPYIFSHNYTHKKKKTKSKLKRSIAIAYKALTRTSVNCIWRVHRSWFVHPSLPDFLIRFHHYECVFARTITIFDVWRVCPLTAKEIDSASFLKACVFPSFVKTFYF